MCEAGDWLYDSCEKRGLSDCEYDCVGDEYDCEEEDAVASGDSHCGAGSEASEPEEADPA